MSRKEGVQSDAATRRQGDAEIEDRGQTTAGRPQESEIRGQKSENNV